MLNIARKLIPIQRKPRTPKTITKKMRKKQVSRMPSLRNLANPQVPNPNPPVVDHGWTNSDIGQSYTK